MSGLELNKDGPLCDYMSYTLHRAPIERYYEVCFLAVLQLPSACLFSGCLLFEALTGPSPTSSFLLTAIGTINFQMWKRWLSFGARTKTNRFEQEALQATSTTGLLWAYLTLLHPIQLGASRPPNDRSYPSPFQAWPIQLLTRATAEYRNGARSLRASSTVDERS